MEVELPGGELIEIMLTQPEPAEDTAAAGDAEAVPLAEGEQPLTGEVVLAAGALATPQTLLLSGVGDAAQLSAHGINVVAHSAAVGQVIALGALVRVDVMLVLGLRCYCSQACVLA